MTFDDGILTIFTVNNAAAPGMKPVEALTEKGQYYYEYANLGVTRYYQAMQANQRVDCVVNVPGWSDIKVTDICTLEDGLRYVIGMVQPTVDENGLRIMKLSLERMGQAYEVPG